jgi:hypothetical protein
MDRSDDFLQLQALSRGVEHSAAPTAEVRTESHYSGPACGASFGQEGQELDQHNGERLGINEVNDICARLRVVAQHQGPGLTWVSHENLALLGAELDSWKRDMRSRGLPSGASRLSRHARRSSDLLVASKPQMGLTDGTCWTSRTS